MSIIAGKSFATQTEWIYATGGATDNRWMAEVNWSGNAIPDANSLVVFSDGAAANTTTYMNFNGIYPTFYATGGILMEADSNQNRIFRGNNAAASGTGIFQLHGYETTINGETMNLLIGNLSTTYSVNFNNGTSSFLTVSLHDSGVVYTDGAVNFNSLIVDDGNSRSLTIKGTGTVSFGINSNDNTFSGGFIIEGGTVQTYGSTTSTTTAVSDGPFGTGTLTLRGGRIQSNSTAGSRSWANAVVLDGSIEFGNSTQTGTLTFSNLANQSTLIAQDSTVTVNNAHVLWQQVVTGDYDLTKRGVGAFTLAATGNSYTGATNVDSGSFWVDGDLYTSEVSVMSEATFGGGGSVGNITLAAGGILAPGGRASGGTLKVFGSVMLEPGAAVLFDLRGNVRGAAAGYDAMDMNGSIDLHGAELQINLTYQPLEDSVFVLIDNFSLGEINGQLSYAGTLLGNEDYFTVSSNSYTQQFQIFYDWTDDNYTGALAIVASAASSVPEPTIIGLLSIFLAGVAMHRRRPVRKRA